MKQLLKTSNHWGRQQNNVVTSLMVSKPPYKGGYICQF